MRKTLPSRSRLRDWPHKKTCKPCSRLLPAFALSSIYEGFGNVRGEALAAGCRVVNTDCPGGSREILGSGRYGRLVPVGDPEALARGLNLPLA